MIRIANVIEYLKEKMDGFYFINEIRQDLQDSQDYLDFFIPGFRKKPGISNLLRRKESIHFQFKFDYRPKYKLGSHRAIPGNSMTMAKPTIITSTKGMIER